MSSGADIDSKKPTDSVPIVAGNDTELYFQTLSYRCWRGFGSCYSTLSSWLCCLPSPVTLVPEAHKGLYYRGGRLIRVLEPGHYFCNPCTETIVMFNTQSYRTTKVSTKSNRSKDGIDLDAETLVTWNINNIATWYHTCQTEMATMTMLQGLALETIRQAIATSTADDFMRSDVKHSLALADSLKKTMESTGVSIVKVTLADIDRSGSFKADLMTKAHIDQENANTMSKAETKAKADALLSKSLSDQTLHNALNEAKARKEIQNTQLSSLKDEQLALGKDGFEALLRFRAATQYANSTNTKLVIQTDTDTIPIASVLQALAGDQKKDSS